MSVFHAVHLFIIVNIAVQLTVSLVLYYQLLCNYVVIFYTVKVHLDILWYIITIIIIICEMLCSLVRLQVTP